MNDTPEPVMVQLRPRPPLPADLDLSRWPCPMLDYRNLLEEDRGLYPLALSGRYVLRLVAWLEVPSCSLPADGDALWHRVRNIIVGIRRRDFERALPVILSGWVEHADGRLYHPRLVAAARRCLGRRTAREKKHALNQF